MTGWDGAGLVQLPFSSISQVVQLVNGTVVASDESGAAILNDSEPLEEQEIQSWELEMEVERVRSLVLDSPTRTTDDRGEMTGLGPVPVLDEQVTESVPAENSRSAEPALEPEPAAREPVPDSATARSDKRRYQVENQPQVVQSVLEAWGLPVEEASDGVCPDQWQVVPDTGQSSENLPMAEPVLSHVATEIPVEVVSGLSEADDFTKASAAEGVDQVSLSAIESVFHEREISLSAEAEVVEEVEVDAVDEAVVAALRAEATEADDGDVALEVTPEERAETRIQTASDVSPARVLPEMEEGSPLQPDLLCQLQSSTPASRAIPIIDSLMEEDFKQEGWTLHSDLNDVATAEIGAGAARNQLSTLWSPLAALALFALLGLFLRRREPAALVLERDSERRQ